MSSEMYVRWEVESKERLHRELMQQLAAERERQAQLFSQMKGDLSAIRASLSDTKAFIAKGAPSVQTVKTRVSNVVDINTGEMVSAGYDMESLEAIQIETDSLGKTLVALDWSDKLEALAQCSSDYAKKIEYVKQMNSVLECAICNTTEAKEAKNSFVRYVNGLLADEDLDFSYFTELVDTRMTQLRESLDFIPIAGSAELFEYYALCEILGEPRQNLSGADLKRMIQKMTTQLFEKKKEEFVYRNLKEVFEELNLSIDSEIELDGMNGQRIVLPGIDDCALFMSSDNEGFIFETVAEVDTTRELSSNQKASIQESAQKICKKHLEIIERMKKRGILLHIDCEEKPNVSRMRKINKASTHQRVKTGAEVRYIGG